MQISDTALPEVKRITRDLFRDERGFFSEFLNPQKLAIHGFTQNFVLWNHSRSLPGVIRGIHFQHAPLQGKLVGVTSGAIVDIAVDLRPGSAHFGQYVAAELSAENGDMLWVPPGFGHAFCVLGDVPADIIYSMTAGYNPQGEGGIAYNDPDINLPWPIAHPIVSARDRQLPRLAEAKENLARWFGAPA